MFITLTCQEDLRNFVYLRLFSWLETVNIFVYLCICAWVPLSHSHEFLLRWGIKSGRLVCENEIAGGWVHTHCMALTTPILFTTPTYLQCVWCVYCTLSTYDVTQIFFTSTVVEFFSRSDACFTVLYSCILQRSPVRELPTYLPFSNILNGQINVICIKLNWRDIRVNRRCWVSVLCPRWWVRVILYKCFKNKTYCIKEIMCIIVLPNLKAHSH